MMHEKLMKMMEKKKARKVGPAEQKAKMDKKWQEHDRLLGRMVLSPMYICWVPPLPSPLCLCAAVRIAAV